MAATTAGGSNAGPSLPVWQNPRCIYITLSVLSSLTAIYLVFFAIYWGVGLYWVSSTGYACDELNVTPWYCTYSPYALRTVLFYVAAFSVFHMLEFLWASWFVGEDALMGEWGSWAQQLMFLTARNGYDSAATKKKSKEGHPLLWKRRSLVAQRGSPRTEAKV